MWDKVSLYWHTLTTPELSTASAPLLKNSALAGWQPGTHSLLRAPGQQQQQEVADQRRPPSFHVFFTCKILLMLFTLLSLFSSQSGWQVPKLAEALQPSTTFGFPSQEGNFWVPLTAIQEYYESTFVSHLLMKNCPMAWSKNKLG